MEKCLQTKMPTFNCILFCLQYPLPRFIMSPRLYGKYDRVVVFTFWPFSVFIGTFENAQSITGRWLTVTWLNVGWLSVTKPSHRLGAETKAQLDGALWLAPARRVHKHVYIISLCLCCHSHQWIAHELFPSKLDCRSRSSMSTYVNPCAKYPRANNTVHCASRLRLVGKALIPLRCCVALNSERTASVSVILYTHEPGLTASSYSGTLEVSAEWVVRIKADSLNGCLHHRVTQRLTRAVVWRETVRGGSRQVQHVQPNRGLHKRELHIARKCRTAARNFLTCEGLLMARCELWHLVYRKCLPALLYGLEVCPLTKTDYRRLDFVVMRFLMKLFCTSNSNIVNECRMRFNFRLPSEIVPTRSVKLMLKLSNVAWA